MKPVKIPDSSAENLITSYKKRQEKRVVREPGQREGCTVSWPCHPPPPCLKRQRAKHISIIAITRLLSGTKVPCQTIALCQLSLQ